MNMILKSISWTQTLLQTILLLRSIRDCCVTNEKCLCKLSVSYEVTATRCTYTLQAGQNKECSNSSEKNIC
jgi:hypothetical protein